MLPLFAERATLANLISNFSNREAWLRVAKRKHGLAHSKLAPISAD